MHNITNLALARFKACQRTVDCCGFLLFITTINVCPQPLFINFRHAVKRVSYTNIDIITENL